MLREEGLAEGQEAKPTGKFWSLVGGLSGGAMGFIVANFPGAIAGAVAGNRLGAVRDARGKSVYSVFQVSVSQFNCHYSSTYEATGITARRQSKAAQRVGSKSVCACCRILKQGNGLHFNCHEAFWVLVGLSNDILG